jgi:hypothetical protein
LISLDLDAIAIGKNQERMEQGREKNGGEAVHFFEHTSYDRR